MRYAVIVCTSCGKARGVDTSRKTSTCQCGRKVQTSRVKRQFVTDSPIDLAEAVAQANVSLAGRSRLPGRKIKRRKGPYHDIAEGAKKLHDRVERASYIANELTRLGQEFSAADLRKVAILAGKESSERILRILLEHGLVYEVSEGSYRAV